MDRQRISRICGIVPIVLSLAAFGLVMVAVGTGLAKRETDEGAAAHTFQLLIVAQVPFILAFVATADWKDAGRVSRVIALQAGAFVLAFAPVAYFKL